MNEFSLLLMIGGGIGLWRVSRQRELQWLDGAILAILGALAGARLGYVLVNLAYFRQVPQEIFQFWLGGLSAPGAITGALLGVGAASLLFRVPYFRMADRLYPLLPPLAVSCWLGCWLAGCAYGAVARPGWLGVPAPDEAGWVTWRVPVQPFAAFSLILFYGLMEALIPIPRPSGWLSSLALTWLTLVGLVASLFRADPMPRWNNLRVDTWVYLVLELLFLSCFTILHFMAHRRSGGKPTNL
ncbi:prolipoprotein diacylglyceryl transferase [Anaerolinea thermophila]|uniref:prolipoprotein diacylglyceryl transferase n=1 Tax=Anaerolinea thermophila TaxID=167964 RepID=UPI0026F1BF2D|nr:prolipoprotein diacylglyceryl transferase family protein [Anaerolinea thermophila]